MLTPPHRRETLLDEFERSGLSAAKYASLVGLKYSTFAAWAQRRREQRSGKPPVKAAVAPADQVRWLEAVVQEAQGSNCPAQETLVVQLPGGVRAELSKPTQAAVLVAIIRELQRPLPPC